MPYRGKPIIGIVGGIGSGKSFVARLLGELGCAVINSDAVAHAIYSDRTIVDTIVRWYGDEILDEAGNLDRRKLAHHIFNDAEHRVRLEALVHPCIHAERERVMAARAGDPAIKAFVWDSPLLIEAGLDGQCDSVLFVDVPREERLRRVRESRGWEEAELDRREASQCPLEEKRRRATAVIRNDVTAIQLRGQLEALLAKIVIAFVPH